MDKNDLRELIIGNTFLKNGCWALLVPEEDILERTADGRPVRVRITRAQDIYIPHGREKSIPKGYEVVGVRAPDINVVAEFLNDLAKSRPDDPYAKAWVTSTGRNKVIFRWISDVGNWWEQSGQFVTDDDVLVFAWD